MITGTKGKTTTVLMLTHILTGAGHRAGCTCTDGVIVAGDYVCRGDRSGSRGAHELLGHRDITAAVLETARGGLLQNGLYLKRCEVAALLNVDREQIGIDGIDTLEQMAALKQQVINAATDAVVLNADDEHCARLIAGYPGHRVILFSLADETAVVKKHVEAGGVVFRRSPTASGDCIVRCEGDSVEPLLGIAELPSCRNGLFPQNIANAMAAAALAEGLSIARGDIRKGLSTFENSLEMSPGRLNFIEGYSQTILLDVATQPPSCRLLGESLKNITVSGKRICMFYTVGNRPDWHYKEMTEALAPHFDCFICYENKKYRRGRAPGEISNLLRSCLINEGVSMECIDMAQDEEEATIRLAHIARKGDLAVLIVTEVHPYLPIFRKAFACHRE
jgi:cyanophycin synthetase